MWYQSHGVYVSRTWHEAEESDVKIRKEKAWNPSDGSYVDVDVEYVVAQCGYGAKGSGVLKLSRNKLRRKSVINLTQNNVCSYCKRRVMKRLNMDDVVIYSP